MVSLIKVFNNKNLNIKSDQSLTTDVWAMDEEILWGKWEYVDDSERPADDEAEADAEVDAALLADVVGSFSIILKKRELSNHAKQPLFYSVEQQQ